MTMTCQLHNKTKAGNRLTKVSNDYLKRYSAELAPVSFEMR